MLSLLTY